MEDAMCLLLGRCGRMTAQRASADKVSMLVEGLSMPRTRECMPCWRSMKHTRTPPASMCRSGTRAPLLCHNLSVIRWGMNCRLGLRFQLRERIEKCSMSTKGSTTKWTKSSKNIGIKGSIRIKTLPNASAIRGLSVGGLH